MENPRFSVSQFLAVTNQTLEYAMPLVEVEGEVSSFKVNQGKFVFFDIKEEESSVGCFMMVYQLRIPIEDGMRVVVTAQPRLTRWGKFSLTVKAIRPLGEGSLKKSFELLKAKFEKEGLFAAERKRQLPAMPQRIAVISSTQAAGYADFIAVINNRWSGLDVLTAHVQVQGESAPDQIIRAINYFNEQPHPVEVIVIIRGGGSADDLAAFNDEKLVRSIAASRIPTMVGVGHETDVSLSDLVADVRAATPSNAAEILVPDKQDMAQRVRGLLYGMSQRMIRETDTKMEQVDKQLESALETIDMRRDSYVRELARINQVLAQVDPRVVLQRGYAILRGDVAIGAQITAETTNQIITMEVQDVREK